MTESIPAYEPTGPLTVCPCCGGYADHRGFCCMMCWEAYRLMANDAQMSGGTLAERFARGRAEWARIGVELRAAGKLPPLPERWGVWCEPHDGYGPPNWTHGSRGVDVYSSVSEAETQANAFRVHRSDVATYTVKPYPGEQTSETLAPPRTETAPPLPMARELGGPATTSAEGDAAKIDPYATHRLAGERRRAELKAERPGWVTQLEEATARIAEIDRELDSLDRTGEVE